MTQKEQVENLVKQPTYKEGLHRFFKHIGVKNESDNRWIIDPKTIDGHPKIQFFKVSDSPARRGHSLSNLKANGWIPYTGKIPKLEDLLSNTEELKTK